MVHNVFLSYSSMDKQIADSVCSILEQNHIKCWIAPRDILSGKNWGEAIGKKVLHIIIYIQDYVFVLVKIDNLY